MTDNNTTPNTAQSEPISTNKKAWKTILLLVFFALALWAVWQITNHFTQGDVATLQVVLDNIDILYVVALVALVLFLVFSDGFKYALINKIINGKYDYAFCVNISIMGKFYDNITPFNTGGQPYQVYQLHKRGYSGSGSAAVPVLKYVVQLICMIVVSVVLYIANNSALDTVGSTQILVVKTSAYVGVAIAAMLPTAVVFFSLFPRFCHSTVAFFCRLLAKIRIIKDADKATDKAVNFLSGYSHTFANIVHDMVAFVILIVINIIDYLLVMSVPYVLLLALGGTDPSWQLMYDVITLNAYTLFSASLVPTPGNSGAIELVYSMVFSPIPMGDGVLFWLVIVWRTATYYIYIIIGLIEMAVLFVRGAVSKRKANKSQPLN